jgi:hypothetical protein
MKAMKQAGELYLRRSITVVIKHYPSITQVLPMSMRHLIFDWYSIDIRFFSNINRIPIEGQTNI